MVLNLQFSQMTNMLQQGSVTSNSRKK
jgi:hypothetical protein